MKFLQNVVVKARNGLIIAMLLSAFALPALAQEGTDSPEQPVVSEPSEVVPADGNGFDWLTDLFTLLGEAVNSYPGGFLSAAVVFVFIQRITNNPKIIDVLEKQFENATKSYPPETIELLRGRMAQFGTSLEQIGNLVKEVGDGVPLSEKALPSKQEEG